MAIRALHSLDGNGEVTGVTHFVCSYDCQASFQLRTGLYNSSEREWYVFHIEELPLGTERCDECGKDLIPGPLEKGG